MLFNLLPSPLHYIRGTYIILIVTHSSAAVYNQRLQKCHLNTYSCFFNSIQLSVIILYNHQWSIIKHTYVILITILLKYRHVSSSASKSNDEGIIPTISTINNHTAGSGCTPLRVFLLQVLQSLQPSGKLLMMLWWRWWWLNCVSW